MCNGNYLKAYNISNKWLTKIAFCAIIIGIRNSDGDKANTDLYEL